LLFSSEETNCFPSGEGEKREGEIKSEVFEEEDVNKEKREGREIKEEEAGEGEASSCKEREEERYSRERKDQEEE
jgi:hypothetical protein